MLGTLVFWFASIADGIDGEMARLTLRESSWGDTLDTSVDQATYLAVYVGLMIGCWRQGLGPAGWALVAGVAAGVPVVASRTRSLEGYAQDGVTALLVAPGDPGALREALDRLHEDRALRERLRSSAHARARAWTWPEYLRELANLPK